MEDRCEYALMKPQGGPGVQLIGGFRERRRTDVSFLDYLTIGQTAGDIHLEQGGRVRVSCYDPSEHRVFMGGDQCIISESISDHIYFYGTRLKFPH